MARSSPCWGQAAAARRRRCGWWPGWRGPTVARSVTATVCWSRPQRIHLPPEKRHVGMVFQSYALWPHMTVRENVSYPLRLRKRPRDEIKSRVDAVLGLIGLGDLGERLVPQLSGGQQQRVALARALVYEPALMLFDEPFSNLDAQLRTQMRLELKTLRRSVAMTRLLRHPRPDRSAEHCRPHRHHERWPHRADRHAAGGLSEARDALRARLPRPGDFAARPRPVSRVVRSELGFNAPGILRADIDATGFSTGDDVEVSIRPEHVTVVPAGAETATINALSATLLDLLFIGEKYEARIDIAGQSNALTLPASQDWTEGQQVLVQFDPKHLQLWRTAAPARPH